MIKAGDSVIIRYKSIYDEDFLVQPKGFPSAWSREIAMRIAASAQRNGSLSRLHLQFSHWAI